MRGIHSMVKGAQRHRSTVDRNPSTGAERGTRLSNGLRVRQVRKLSYSGKQTAILSTNYENDPMRLAASMFARWSQENFFRYMRQHYDLERLAEYGTEAIPDTVRVVNPAWRQLDGQIRRLNGKRQRDMATFGAQSLAGELSEETVTEYQQRQAELQENIEHTGKQLELLKDHRGAIELLAFATSDVEGPPEECWATAPGWWGLHGAGLLALCNLCEWENQPNDQCVNSDSLHHVPCLR
jgi:uncharacterized small protein (DUF1192 family)